MRLVALCAILGIGGVASADIPPPAIRVELCTVNAAKKAGEDCYSCATFVGDTSRDCSRPGYVHRCSTRPHGRARNEIWCGRPAAASAPVAAADAAPAPVDAAPLPDARNAPDAAPARVAVDSGTVKSPAGQGCAVGGADVGSSLILLGLFALLGATKRNNRP